jgi:hypothetical protein
MTARAGCDTVADERADVIAFAIRVQVDARRADGATRQAELADVVIALEHGEAEPLPRPRVPAALLLLRMAAGVVEALTARAACGAWGSEGAATWADLRERAHAAVTFGECLRHCPPRCVSSQAATAGQSYRQ